MVGKLKQDHHPAIKPNGLSPCDKMSKEKRTEIGDLGEFGLIEHINAKFTNVNKSSVKGIGDDAAVIDCGDKYQLISTDMLVEGVHFDLSYMPLQHLGYKAVSVNVSDIAAMNGIPKQITVSLGLSNRFSVEAIDALYEGIKFACEDYKVDLVGGDTTASQSGLIISITAIGEVDKNKVVYRNTAKVNDIICVTGDLGGAYIGLQTLEREKQVFQANPDMQPELKDAEYAIKRQLKPTARMDVIHELIELDIVPSSMIDVSDGLVSDLFHICKQSDVGAAIFEDKLPMSNETMASAIELKLDPVTATLNGGEDYELLFTISQSDYEKVKNHSDISMIGYISDKSKGKNLITKNENAIELKAQGWKHF